MTLYPIPGTFSTNPEDVDVVCCCFCHGIRKSGSECVAYTLTTESSVAASNNCSCSSSLNSPFSLLLLSSELIFARVDNDDDDGQKRLSFDSIVALSVANDGGVDVPTTRGNEKESDGSKHNIDKSNTDALTHNMGNNLIEVVVILAY